MNYFYSTIFLCRRSSSITIKVDKVNILQILKKLQLEPKNNNQNYYYTRDVSPIGLSYRDIN